MEESDVLQMRIATDTAVIHGLKQRIAELEGENSRLRAQLEHYQTNAEMYLAKLKASDDVAINAIAKSASLMAELEAERERRDKAEADSTVLLEALKKTEWVTYAGSMGSSAYPHCTGCGCLSYSYGGEHAADCPNKVVHEHHPGQSLLDRLAKLERVADAYKVLRDIMRLQGQGTLPA